MKTKTLLLLAVPLAVFVGTARAADTAAATLQKGLFEEEANHSLDAAIQAYQSVVARFDDERKLAATAVFRLGECYRKLGQTNEANAQYQRVVRDFSDQTQLVKLSREFLGPAAPVPTGIPSTPGTPPPIIADGQAYYPATEDEAKELQRLIAMTKDSPDLVNAKAGNGTPLWQAAGKDELAVAKYLLAHGAEMNPSINVPPLHQAALNGRKSMTELLLAHGADVNAKSTDGSTPLHFATSQGFKAVAELLLAHGADVNARDDQRKTPLHKSVSFPAMLEFLIAHGADVNAKDGNGSTPLLDAIASHESVGARLLRAKGADVNVADLNGRNALHYAAAYATLMQVLLADKANVNAKDSNGHTPLFDAVFIGKNEVVELLLNHGADANAQTADGQRPLLVAIARGDKAMVQLLIDRGAEVNRGAVVNSGGVRNVLPSPLRYARLVLENNSAPPSSRPALNGIIDLLRKHGAVESPEERARQGGKVFFTGAVNAPFLQLEPGQVTTLFGGLVQRTDASRPVDLTHVKLIRVDPATGKAVTNTVDVSKVRSGDKSKDIPLQDGDRIEVPPVNYE